MVGRGGTSNWFGHCMGVELAIEGKKCSVGGVRSALHKMACPSPYSSGAAAACRRPHAPNGGSFEASSTWQEQGSRWLESFDVLLCCCTICQRRRISGRKSACCLNQTSLLSQFPSECSPDTPPPWHAIAPQNTRVCGSKSLCGRRSMHIFRAPLFVFCPHLLMCGRRGLSPGVK